MRMTLFGFIVLLFFFACTDNSLPQTAEAASAWMEKRGYKGAQIELLSLIHQGQNDTLQVFLLANGGAYLESVGKEGIFAYVSPL